MGSRGTEIRLDLWCSTDMGHFVGLEITVSTPLTVRYQLP